MRCLSQGGSIDFAFRCARPEGFLATPLHLAHGLDNPIHWSLGLGLISLIPFIGILFGLIGLVLGIVAFTTISRRKLPRKKGVALSGIGLPILGVLVTAGLIFLMSNK